MKLFYKAKVIIADSMLEEVVETKLTQIALKIRNNEDRKYSIKKV